MTFKLPLKSDGESRFARSLEATGQQVARIGDKVLRSNARPEVAARYERCGVRVEQRLSRPKQTAELLCRVALIPQVCDVYAEQNFRALRNVHLVAVEQVGLREPRGATCIAATCKIGSRASSCLDHCIDLGSDREALVYALADANVKAHAFTHQVEI